MILNFICVICAQLSDDGDIQHRICLDCDDALIERKITEGFFIQNCTNLKFYRIGSEPPWTNNPLLATHFGTVFNAIDVTDDINRAANGGLARIITLSRSDLHSIDVFFFDNSSKSI